MIAFRPGWDHRRIMQQPLEVSFMRSASVLFALVFVFCLAAPATAFDCGRIDFGTPLAELDDGYFVKYKQAGGVSYYNYTGPCRMALHDYTNAAISYAFVDGRIYARIIRTFDEDIDKGMASVTAVAGQPTMVERDGEWTVYFWHFPGDVKSKVKYNPTTRETRSAVYYEPLRAKLQEHHDPAVVETD